jgi:hypothetical protein
MMIVHYPSKKDLKAAVGKSLCYDETSMFGPEYKSSGTFTVAGRPHMSSVVKREFFATVTMENDLIKSVK